MVDRQKDEQTERQSKKFCRTYNFVGLKIGCRPPCRFGSRTPLIMDNTKHRFPFIPETTASTAKGRFIFSFRSRLANFAFTLESTLLQK